MEFLCHQSPAEDGSGAGRRDHPDMQIGGSTAV